MFSKKKVFHLGVIFTNLTKKKIKWIYGSRGCKYKKFRYAIEKRFLQSYYTWRILEKNCSLWYQGWKIVKKIRILRFLKFLKKKNIYSKAKNYQKNLFIFYHLEFFIFHSFLGISSHQISKYWKIRNIYYFICEDLASIFSKYFLWKITKRIEKSLIFNV